MVEEVPLPQIFPRNVSIGQNRVKLDWKRFNATKAVKRKNQGLTQ
jgi:hypothetical protein